MPKLNITVCMGSSCFARGNQQNLEFLEAYIQEHEVDADIELSGARCENKCAFGPNILINVKEYHSVDENKLKDILEKLLNE